MQVLDPGHAYLLTPFDGEPAIQLRFMKREGEAYPGNVGHYSGTNLQEVYRACIDRHLYLDKQVPCDENKMIVAYLRSCIRLLEQRAAVRHGRDPAADEFDYRNRIGIETLPFCTKCGHINCGGHE